MNNFNLPKKYLSYSAFSLWQKDKGAFRRKYYLGEPSFETWETIFGKTIAERLEKGDKIDGVEQVPIAEYRIELDLVPGLRLLGYLDGFDDEKLKITEFKTGHLSPDGKAPWDKLKVRRHKQLVFYAMLVLLKFGKFNPWVTLQWLETKFKNKSVVFDGHELVSESKELELTGLVKTFKRRICKWEIEKLKEEVLKVAEEISEDFSSWQKDQAVGQ
jgi:hypothetical protein